MLTPIVVTPAHADAELAEHSTSHQPALNANFWNCTCRCNFVHSKLEAFCCVCGCCKHQQPDSQANEVTNQIVLPQGLPRTVTLYGMTLEFAGKGLFPYACTAQDQYPQAAIYLNDREGAWIHQYAPDFVQEVNR